MSIPESKLEAWSSQGAITTAKGTHESIRNALNQFNNWSQIIDYEVYLQGSYKNDTNIRGDSDVDLVVQLNSTFHHDLSALSVYETNLFHQKYSDVTYGWSEFKSDVLKALRLYFGTSTVSEGKNCLIVKEGSNRLPADVLVCLQYRKYRSFPGYNSEKYIEGVHFFSSNGYRWVVNYPKAHYDNGVQKNSVYATKGWFKPTVRIFKNARTHLIHQGVISESLAPSYFLQCLLYNAPNSAFGGSYNATFYNILKWLNDTDISGAICQNGELTLFGDAPEQWSLSSARAFINSIINLWNNW